MSQSEEEQIYLSRQEKPSYCSLLFFDEAILSSITHAIATATLTFLRAAIFVLDKQLPLCVVTRLNNAVAASSSSQNAVWSKLLVACTQMQYLKQRWIRNEMGVSKTMVFRLNWRGLAERSSALFSELDDWLSPAQPVLWVHVRHPGRASGCEANFHSGQTVVVQFPGSVTWCHWAQKDFFP